jgi:predicted enzyme related to lactoylglutathione lyase
MSGEINWFELPAEDTGKARTFYTGLFGWTTMEFGPDYHLIQNGPAGAITTGDFAHPRVYFATADIDASVKRVHELGGAAEDVQNVPDVGRIVHCKDDQGVPFSMYEPAAQA